MFRETYKNIASNVALIALKLAIVFVMTPVLVRNLGNYDYGIWEITVSLVGYFGLLEVGLRPAVARFAARYRSLDEPEELQALYANASFLLGISGFIAFLSFLAWALFAPDTLTPAGDAPNKYRWFLIIVGLQLLIVMPSYVAEGMLDGFQKFHLKNVIAAINSLIGAGLVLALIEPRNALLLLAMLNSGGIVIKYLVFQALIRKEGFGQIRWRSSLIRRSRLKELIAFGGKSFVPHVSAALISSLPNLIIGLTLGAAQVVFFALPRALSQHTRNLILNLTIVFMPMFSDMTARGEVSHAREVFYPVACLIVAISSLGAVGISAVGADFISVWVGPEYGERGRSLVVLLAIHLWILTLNPLDSKLLTAMNRHGVFARLTPVSAAVAIIACFFGSKFWGLEGIAIGLILAAAVIILPVLRATAAALESGVLQYIRRVILPCAVPSAMAWLIHKWLRPYISTDSYIGIFANAGLMTLSFAAVFILVTDSDVRRLIWRLVGMRR